MNFRSPETEPTVDHLSRRQCVKILVLTLANAACTTEAAAMSRIGFLPHVDSNFRQDSNPPTVTPETRPTTTPTPETLETQLERIISSFRLTDAAPSEALIRTVPHKLEMRVDQNAPYTVSMRADLKQQTANFIREDAEMDPSKGGGFDDAMILFFGNTNDVPKAILQWRLGYSHTRRDEDRIYFGYFGVAKVTVGGRRLRIVTYAPENKMLFDTKLGEYTIRDSIQGNLGLRLTNMTVTGYDLHDLSAPQTTREQILRMDQRDQVFKKLSVITDR